MFHAAPPDCSTQKLLNICETYQKNSQLINQPTCITQHTSSAIDLFLTNNPLVLLGYQSLRSWYE